MALASITLLFTSNTILLNRAEVATLSTDLAINFELAISAESKSELCLFLSRIFYFHADIKEFLYDQKNWNIYFPKVMRVIIYKLLETKKL